MSLEHSRAEWRRVMDLNVGGVFFGAQAAARHMVANGGGSIVTLASMYGQRAVNQRVAYCTSKASVIMLTEVLGAGAGRARHPGERAGARLYRHAAV